tara:strand:+ start:10885 stop:11823 length:939 start_codon:yes stop_codon:yes gene_type:complete
VVSKSFPSIRRDRLTTLQVNVGYKCNQACIHCHVNAGPHRWEMMNNENIDLIITFLEKYQIKTLDITGGAPELHPKFRYLVNHSRKMGIEVIDRCNLTILSEPGHEDLALFLANNKVIVTASLPCYEETNVDKQRGKGVFQRSIAGLRQLNNFGYGKKDMGLILNLVFNPQGPNLPPPQALLESDYKKKLKSTYDIDFNQLFTIANMPINRFAIHLKHSGLYDSYQELLINSHNPSNLETVMCRNLISVDWKGFIYDCDFNQQLKMSIGEKHIHLSDITSKTKDFRGDFIKVGSHCFGCTAGNGSSCGGALN